MDALGAAAVLKEALIDDLLDGCDDPASARPWFEASVRVLNREEIDIYLDYAEHAEAAVVLEGSPDGCRPADCWCTEIAIAVSNETALLGDWFVDCHTCWAALIVRKPTAEQIEAFRNRRLAARRQS